MLNPNRKPLIKQDTQLHSPRVRELIAAAYARSPEEGWLHEAAFYFNGMRAMLEHGTEYILRTSPLKGIVFVALNATALAQLARSAIGFDEDSPEEDHFLRILDAMHSAMRADGGDIKDGKGEQPDPKEEDSSGVDISDLISKLRG